MKPGANILSAKGLTTASHRDPGRAVPPNVRYQDDEIIFRHGRNVDPVLLSFRARSALRRDPPEGRDHRFRPLGDGESLRLVRRRAAVPTSNSTPARSNSTRAVAFDGKCLRERLRRGSRSGIRGDEAISAGRVPTGCDATRLQLMDVYGHGTQTESKPHEILTPRARWRPTLVPLSARVTSERPTTPLRSRRAGQRRSPLTSLPGQFNMLYAFGVGEVPISISGDPEVPDDADSHDPCGRSRSRTRMRRLKAGRHVGVRGPFGTGWPVDRGRRQRRAGGGRRHRSGAAASGHLPAPGQSRQVRQTGAALRRANPGDSVPQRSWSLARPVRHWRSS